MAKGRESGCYRDDESGSIPSLGMTHHTQARSCDRGSADTLFSGTGRRLRGLTVHVEAIALLEPKNRDVSE